MRTPSLDPQANAAARPSRDRELVHYVARHGLVTVGHIMAAMEVGQAITYRRVSRCIAAGLLERHAVLHSEPSVIRATAAGIQFAGLGLPMASLSPGRVDHYLRCASVARHLHAEFGPRVLTELEIAELEAIEESRFASAEVGEGRTVQSRYHRADLLVLADGGSHVAVEVELTPKAPYRLRSIIRGWRRTRSVAEVRYYCRPGKTHRAVDRAVKAVRADESGKFVVIEGVPE